MPDLARRIQFFQERDFPQLKPLFENLKQGQKPFALFITCSDSRIDPNLLIQSAPGEIFVLRNAGNLIPPYTPNAANSGEAGTIEFAIGHLGIKEIVICGHSHCGAMAGILNPETLKKLPVVEKWLSNAEMTRRMMDENYAHLGPEERLARAIEVNVLAQVKNLKTHPAVAVAIEQGLKIHAWIYTFESGEVLAFDWKKKKFELVTPDIRCEEPLPLRSKL